MYLAIHISYLEIELVFIYVPKNTKLDRPLQSYFRINTKNMGQFERTIIIVDDNSELHYMEGCTAPTYTTSSLHAAVVEIYVGKNATVNGKTRYQLLGDNTFNFFKEPYENKAYIFSAYWYPYSNVRAYIIASSTNNNINKATGHAVYGRNWAWKDGYYLGRVAWKRYNTYNPFVKFIKGKKIVDTAILVPESGGVI